MAAKEAPEKIYVPQNSTLELGLEDFWVDHQVFGSDVEYTRTDAFIEKAIEWLKKNADNYTWYDEFEGESGMIDEFIDDFKNYMKGEYVVA